MGSRPPSRKIPMNFAARPDKLEDLRSRAREVARLLKTLSHPNRLLIACQLMEGEQGVGEIGAATGVAQPLLSRELARLRRDGLLKARRESRTVHYSLADERLANLVAALCEAFGSREKSAARLGPAAPRKRPAKPAKRKAGRAARSKRRRT